MKTTKPFKEIREMVKDLFRTGLPSAVAFVLVLGLILAPVAALPGPPSFSPAVWGDGELWGTKSAAIIPPPNGRNNDSFDALFVVTNSNNPMGQLPVAEAAPRNFNYNGGRWYTHTVEWTQSGFDAHGIVPVLKSYDNIMMQYSLGHLTITPGSPEGGPPDFFECPLLPIK